MVSLRLRFCSLSSIASQMMSEVSSNHNPAPVITSVKGFLLTARWREGENGTQLEFWFSTPDGPVCAIAEQPSVCFVGEDDAEKARRLALAERIDLTLRAVELRTFSGRAVVACYVRQQEIHRFRQLLEDWDIAAWETDIRPADRYLMERFIRGGAEIYGTREDSGHFRICHDARIRSADYHPELNVLSVDIETSYPRKGQPDRLFSIGASGMHRGQRYEKVWMIGDPEAESPLPYLEFVEDEVSLMQHFLEGMKHWDPDVLIGWNFIQFDMEFLQRKCDELDIEFALGRDGSAARWREDSFKQGRKYVQIAGRCVIDGIEMLRQAEYRFESFALDAVAEELLGRNKLLSGDTRSNEIEYLFEHDKPALAEYNLEDCRLVEDIFHKTELMDFARERTTLTGLPLDRMGGSVAGFENLYLPLLHRAGYVAPNYGEGFDGVKSPGGYVMDSRPGLYDSVLVLDFKSLYPSIIRTFRIDPMGMIEGLIAHEHNPENTIQGFNGGWFHREKHCLPDLIHMLWQQRDKAKQQGNTHLSQAIKIIMSSFYGVLGSEGCRFFDVRLSSSITQRGHEIIQRSSEWIEQQGFDVIYGDTDSVFVWLGEGKDFQEANKIGKRLARTLNQWWQQRLLDEHDIECHMEIEYETHYRRFFMPSIRGEETGSKKRYAGTIESQQGDITTVFKGLEAVRTDWTPLARHFQQELFDRVFRSEPFHDWMKQYVSDLMEGKLDAQLIYRKRLRQPLSAYRKNIPPHAKAAAALERWRETHMMPPLFRERGGWIEYLITTSGPQPLDDVTAPVDYGHYLEKQLAPVADGLLSQYGTSFSEICGQQLALF